MVTPAKAALQKFYLPFFSHKKIFSVSLFFLSKLERETVELKKLEEIRRRKQLPRRRRSVRESGSKKKKRVKGDEQSKVRAVPPPQGHSRSRPQTVLSVSERRQ